jgi:hypothetical protein
MITSKVKVKYIDDKEIVFDNSTLVSYPSDTPNCFYIVTNIKGEVISVPFNNVKYVREIPGD